MSEVLSSDLLNKMNAYWRAANYLTVGQIYLQDNPLLEAPLKPEHIKPRLLEHWGTVSICRPTPIASSPSPTTVSAVETTST